MILSVHDVERMILTDSQRNAMYAFDEILEDEIKAQGKIFPKLYRNLNENASLQELSNNICDDFGLPYSTFNISEDKTSYYFNFKIYMTPSAIYNKDVEALLHEYAHFFNHLIFKAEDGLSHNGDFVCVFRWLLDYYGIVSKNDFNETITYFAENVVLYDDYIESFKFLTKNEFNILFDELSPLHNNLLISGTWTYSGAFEKKYINTKKQVHFFIKNESKNIFIYSCINKLACYYNDPFSNLTLEQLKNTVIVSPAFLMNYSGESERRKHYPKYYGFVEADGSFFDNPLSCDWVSLVKLGDDSTPDEKKIIQKEITKYSKNLKNEYGKNVVKAKSELEFQTFQSIMRTQYYLLRNL